jgi:osmotically inducible protein OsmC
VGDVPGVDRETFVSLAEEAKTTCPVSLALAGVEISLHASLTAR